MGQTVSPPIVSAPFGFTNPATSTFFLWLTSQCPTFDVKAEVAAALGAVERHPNYTAARGPFELDVSRTAKEILRDRVMSLIESIEIPVVLDSPVNELLALVLGGIRRDEIAEALLRNEYKWFPTTPG
jgi:hypothetical protein